MHKASACFPFPLFRTDGKFYVNMENTFTQEHRTPLDFITQKNTLNNCVCPFRHILYSKSLPALQWPSVIILWYIMCIQINICEQKTLLIVPAPLKWPLPIKIKKWPHLIILYKCRLQVFTSASISSPWKDQRMGQNFQPGELHWGRASASLYSWSSWVMQPPNRNQPVVRNLYHRIRVRVLVGLEINTIEIHLLSSAFRGTHREWCPATASIPIRDELSHKTWWCFLHQKR